MYLKNIIIENYGPLKNIDLPFEFNEEGSPLPLILTGKNGSGKTILLSHIVNSLIAAKQRIYTNCEVEQGKVYKTRDPAYITSGKTFSFSKIEYADNSYVTEWQLQKSKEETEKTPDFTLPREEWNEIPNKEHTYFKNNFNKETASLLLKKRVALYFPSNRFEEPAWLNEKSLTSPVNFLDLQHIDQISNRSIISLSSLRSCQEWLLDVILDAYIQERRSHPIPIPVAELANGKEKTKMQLIHIPVFSGTCNMVYASIIRLVQNIFEDNDVNLLVQNRKFRMISVAKSGKIWIPNLFQLSSGETLLLSLFLSIIKDYDLSEAEFSSLNDIEGIVLIDEIDMHLHVNLQKKILPSLIKMFPKIQFVITTHSPMFLLGMETVFGSDGYRIIDLPSGNLIKAEDFSEFGYLFETMKETAALEELLEEKIRESHLPVVFVEGDYDIKYLKKTIEYYYDETRLKCFSFIDGGGYGSLDKTWGSMNKKVTKAFTRNVLLLYDCDMEKQDGKTDKCFKKVIPSNKENPIKKGIENLLSPATITKLEKTNEKFIDIKYGGKIKVRGEIKNTEEEKSVNEDEKKNICDWLCANGEKKDFEGFCSVIEIIIDFLCDIGAYERPVQ